RPEDVLRAVAVVDVEIDERGTLGAVLLLRVARDDRGAVEEAEAHRLCRLGVVAGRAHGDEGVLRLAGHHLVDREHAAADAAQRRLVAAGRHGRVGVEPHHAFVGRGVLDRLDVVHRMAERDRVPFAERRLLTRQRLEGFRFERLVDRAQTVGPFRMAGGCHVVETGGMGHEESGHATIYAGDPKYYNLYAVSVIACEPER